MAILRQIAQLGQPVLRAPARPVADPLAPTVQALIDDLLVTVADANGVGIAAPQVFEPLTLFIVASHPNPRYPHAPPMEPTAMINPEIASDPAGTGSEPPVPGRPHVRGGERPGDRRAADRSDRAGGAAARRHHRACGALHGVTIPPGDSGRSRRSGIEIPPPDQPPFVPPHKSAGAAETG